MTEDELKQRLPKSYKFIEQDFLTRGVYTYLKHGQDPIAIIDQLLIHHIQQMKDHRENIQMISKSLDSIDVS